MIKHMTTLTMCPIPQGAPSLSSVLTMIPISHCPYVKKGVKLSKRCQKVKNIDYGGGSQKKKKKIHIMRFTHIDVNFDVTYDGDQKPSKWT